MIIPFSPEEIEKIQRLRSACSDVLQGNDENDDHFLIRWLRARNLDVDKAEEMLRKSVKWRKDMKADWILEHEEVPLEYRRMYPTGLLGRDADDCVVLLLPLGRFDHRFLLGKEGMETALKYNMIWMERMLSLVKKTENETGKKGLRLVEIVDMEHYSYRELTYGPAREYIVAANRAYDENYPEMVKSIVIINAPKIFAMLFNFIKPFLAKETLAKISIYGGDEESWKNVIRQRCNVDCVPVRWGGRKEGTNLYCSEDNSIWIDGPIPYSFFTNDSLGAHLLNTERIKARDKFQVELTFDTAQHPVSSQPHLTWKLKVDSHDIGFYITFKPTSPPSSMPELRVIPDCRVDSKQGLKEGSLECRESGLYTLVFDNRYSLARSKTIHYSVQVTHHGDENKVIAESQSG